jgi:hypothetical protein
MNQYGCSMLLKYLSANPRLIFLIDGLGALLSSLLLLLVAHYEAFFGMPKNVLFSLVPVTTMFLAYSIGCYMINPKSWKRFLAPIALANLLYGGLTLVLVLYHHNRLTVLGTVYFLSEIIVLFFLSRLEFGLVKYKSGH